MLAPHFLQLTPNNDVLFISAYGNHTIVAMDTLTDAIVRVVAGVSGEVGGGDGFGSISRFNQPKGIALVGHEHGWPCLYVHGELSGSLREIRLRDQYVRTIPFVGLPSSVDIESIVPYTNRSTHEFGLLLINLVGGSRIFFFPIGMPPVDTVSVSSEASSSATGTPESGSSSHFSALSPSLSTSVTNPSTVSLAPALTASPRASKSASLSADRSSPTVSHTSVSLNSYTPSLCLCNRNAARVSLAAPASLCVLCHNASASLMVVSNRPGALLVNDTSTLSGGAWIDASPIDRASLLSLAVSPVLVTLTVSGSGCWYATDLAVREQNTSHAVKSNSGVGDSGQLTSYIELLVTPLGGAWLSPLASDGGLLFQSTSLTLNVSLACTASSAAADDGAVAAFVVVSIPCPALPRTLSEGVTTGVAVLQWLSAFGGPGGSGAVGRLTAIRSLELCSAGGLGGIVNIEVSSCSEDALGGLLGNMVVALGATWVLLAACWLLAPAGRTDWLVAGAQNIAFPSSLAPLMTTLLPSTAGLAVIALASVDMTSVNGCQGSIITVVAVIALCVCVCVVGSGIAAHVWASTLLDNVPYHYEHQANRDRTRTWSLWAVWVAKGYRWLPRPGGAVSTSHRHFAVLLNEFRKLWYSAVDAGTLFTAGLLTGAAQSSGSISVCAACGIATSVLYSVQLVICLQSRPYMSLFGNVCGALTLLLSAISTALQAAQLFLQYAAAGEVSMLRRLMLGLRLCATLW
jgi:hypothetical protein